MALSIGKKGTRITTSRGGLESKSHLNVRVLREGPEHDLWFPTFPS